MMFKKPPGIEDIFPDRIDKWNFIFNTSREVFRIFNYKEIIIPVMEYTDVFSRGIGDETDIVSKEMFTFEDRGGRSLALRPEGTASVVRAYIENGEYNRLSTCKFFYFGPMFRAERPQKGRLRQFNQFGAEFFGSDLPYHDYEIIAMMDMINRHLGLEDYSLLLNSIGCQQCRPRYIADLTKYYTEHQENLCQDCQRRLEKNPLRLLDCKKERCQQLKSTAPVIASYLCDKCTAHHAALQKYLSTGGIAYKEDPYLVRGLDYYTRTTFEFVSDRLGGQNAFAAGGRYDTLVETFGGKPTPAVGFAAGIERIDILLEERAEGDQLDVFIVYSGTEAYQKGLELSNHLRENHISVDLDPASKSLASQFKKADREKARVALIIGEEEIRENRFAVKNMETGIQKSVNPDNIVHCIASILTSGDA